MRQDIAEYVSACPTYTRNKGSNRAAAGLLNPLPTPNFYLVSHFFGLCLPVSEGNTTILTVVNCFFNCSEPPPNIRLSNCCYTKGPPYRVGKLVWLFTHDLPLRSKCRKLLSRFIGPFSISKIVNGVAIRLKLLRSTKVYNLSC